MRKLLLVLLAMGTSMFGANAFAWDSHHGHHGHYGYGGHYGHYGQYDHSWHHGHHGYVNLVFAAPLFWRPYDYFYPYPRTQVVVERQPEVYVQREVAAAQPAPANYWYYCPDTKTYYPYVQTCPSGWLQVVPQIGTQGPQP